MEYKKIFKKRMTIAVTSIVIISLVILAFSLSSIAELNSKNEQTNTVDFAEPRNAYKSGPTFPVTAWGYKASSLEDAKKGVPELQVTLPNYIPDNLQLDSLRVNTERKSIVAIYMPNNSITTDQTTLVDIGNAGGFFIIYKIDTSDYSLEWMKEFASEASNIRRVEMINDIPAIINKGNPDAGITAQVLMWKGDMRINIVSLKLDDLELKKIAESITFNN